MSSNSIDKAKRLFTYIEKALSTDDKIIRDFRDTIINPSPWWLADYPKDIDTLFIKNFNDENNIQESNTIIKVQKKNIKDAPKLPEELIEWIDEINPIDKPKVKESIDRKIAFDQDKERVRAYKDYINNCKQDLNFPIPDILNGWIDLKMEALPELIKFKYVPDNWADHLELNNLLEDYIKNEWIMWSDDVRKIYKSNLLYDQLYALRLLLKNEGDSYELLLGNGVLVWDNKLVGQIYSPIFITPLVLEFNASNRSIEIVPDPIFKSFVETTSISELDNLVENDLDKWMNKINSSPFDFWHLESLKLESSAFLNYLSCDVNDSFSDNMSSAPEKTDKPSIWNSPVIFVRKRSNTLWSKYANAVRKDIEQNNGNTEFIDDLIGEYKEHNIGSDNIDGEKQVTEIPESELLFPLPWNEEQKRIAERIEFNYGMVVKGPPGTGKSHTIANLIARFLAQGKSVLVTSHTSKALEVLRDKLPESIRSLVVSQLQQNAKHDDILQQSISEISSNLGERYTKFSDENVISVRKQLEDIRKEKAKIANFIRQHILTDSTKVLRINETDITPIEAAKFLSEHENDSNFFWFTDNIEYSNELNFTKDDLFDLYNSLIKLKLDEVDLYKFDFPDISLLPDNEIIVSTFNLYKEQKEKYKNCSCKNLLDRDIALELLKLLDDACRVINSINKDYESDIFNKCVVSQSERDKWTSILIKIQEKIKTINSNKILLVGHKIENRCDLDSNDLLDSIHILQSKLSANQKLNSISKIFLSSNAKKLLESFTVDGRVADDAVRLSILNNYISAFIAEKEIMTLLEQSFFEIDKSIDVFDKNNNIDLIKLEVLIKKILHIVEYYDDFKRIDDICVSSNNDELVDVSFMSISDIEKIRSFAESSVACDEMSKLSLSFNEWIASIGKTKNKHPIQDELVDAIKCTDSIVWKNKINEFNNLVKNKILSEKVFNISNKIKEYAPNLYRYIVECATNKKTLNISDNLELVWKNSRIKSWLDSIYDKKNIDELQKEHERLSKKEFQLNAELVSLLAWQRQIDKVTKQQRDALMAWSDAMRKYGKGSGKYANKSLFAAQEALKYAKDAVPVWIMPLYKAAQMFSEPRAGMFDVVIFDEASQCDIRGLNIAYLGKKLLIVGDPDQISPAGLFQDQTRIYEFIDRFLYDIPHKESFSISSSLFDLAKIRIPNMVQLNEHFRCVPEIIAFSNYNIYEGKLKPLRYPNPKGKLTPALVPVFVESGYQNTNNKVNEPEAKAIVDKIVECLESPEYQQRPDGRLCSFGVISLLADDQAKYIKDLLMRHEKVGERVIEERNIICGDSYAFQGDERDVIFLSMVKAFDINNPNSTIKAIADKSSAQRFNVAATRARDQVFLFHSIPLNEFKNPEDWRYKLLNWYYNPKIEEIEFGREALKKQYDSGVASQFSFDVGNLLIDRGYNVIPEYPVIGYRIDLVIQGDNARLAVECDGDQYHTLENWENDQIREMQLRRAGWEFWRVTGSSFYRYKEKALDSLWQKLNDLGIKPMI